MFKSQLAHYQRVDWALKLAWRTELLRLDFICLTQPKAIEIKNERFPRISSFKWRTDLCCCSRSYLCPSSNYFRADWKLRCVCNGLHQPSFTNSSELPDCESQYLRHPTNPLHSFGLDGSPHNTTVDFWGNVLPRKRLLYANIPSGVVNVCDNYQCEQVLLNCSPTGKRDILQQAKGNGDDFHVVVLGSLHLHSSKSRLGSLWILLIARNVFHRRREQLLVHDFSCAGVYRIAVFCLDLVLRKDLLGCEKK